MCVTLSGLEIQSPSTSDSNFLLNFLLGLIYLHQRRVAKPSEKVLTCSHNGRFKLPPKSLFPPLLAKRITVWPMYQTSLSHTFSRGQSHPSLTPSKSSVLPLAAWLMTFILMEMEEEETALDADLDTHVYLRQENINRPATFLASMLCDTHTHKYRTSVFIHTHHSPAASYPLTGHQSK